MHRQPYVATTRYQRHSRERWSELIRAHEHSGLTQREFCDSHGLALSTFAHWRRRLHTETASSAPPAFVAVTVDAEQTTTSIQRRTDHVASDDADAPGLSVTLTNGLLIEGVRATNLDTVVALVQAL